MNVNRRQLAPDFWTFWTGQTISNLGSSFTQFALPLLIFKLTGSAVNLALATASEFLPYLLFGLIIGAWVDRVDRKRAMVGLDIVYSVGNSMFEEFKREEYAPPPLLKRMIAAGRLGHKSGRGFYDYGK